MAGTTWPALTAGSKAKASDVENKFDWIEGSIVPMNAGSKTNAAYDLGEASYKWKDLYLSGVFKTPGGDITPGTPADDQVTTVKLADANVTTVKIKTGTGSVTDISVSTEITMQDFCFFPNVHQDNDTGIWYFNTFISNPSDNYVARFRLTWWTTQPSNADVYYRYISASGPPEIWIVKDEAKKIYTIWESDDPAPNGKAPIECFDKDGNKVGQMIMIIPPDNYAEIKAKAGLAKIGKILLEEWEIDEESRPKRPNGLAPEILVRKLKKKTK